MATVAATSPPEYDGKQGTVDPTDDEEVEVNMQVPSRPPAAAQLADGFDFGDDNIPEIETRGADPRAESLPRVPYAVGIMSFEVIILWIVVFVVALQVAVVYPFLFLPFGLPLAWYTYKHRELVHYSMPCSTFAFGFIPGMLIIWFTETILFVIWHVIFSAAGVNTSPDREEEEKDTGYIFFWLCVSFGVFALVTEVGKYLVLKYVRLIWTNAFEINGSIIMLVAGSLGFSVANNVILLILNALYHNWSIGITFAWAIYLTLVMDTVHCLTAYYIAIAVVRRDLFSHEISTFDVLGVPLFARGILVFCSSPIPAFLNGGVMWAVIVIVDLVIVAGIIFFIMRAQSHLPREHIERAGYFQVLGMGSEPPSVNVDLDLRSRNNVREEEEDEEDI